MVTIRLVGLVSGEDTPFDGHYVVHYNAGYVHPSGEYDGGELLTSANIAHAITFSSALEATRYWKQQAPEPWAIRTDGKPNRPLTAYTVELKKRGEED